MARLCAGIDPSGSQLDEFTEAVALHETALRASSLQIGILKPNLAFFLRHGSPGLALLEKFVASQVATHEVILDCKCNEIANSLESWLSFAFVSLGVTGITVNPFLGEKSILMAAEFAAKYAGKRGRVYVLCATSEQSSEGLGFMQDQPEKILNACVNVRNQVVGTDAQLQQLCGVVVGANRGKVLFSDAMRASKLSILAPGLGAQGASWSVVQESKILPNEVTFPVSRALFAGGKSSPAEAHEAIKRVSAYFL